MSIVSIAFDEGRRSQFQHAFPILEKAGMRGTVYLLTGYRGKPWKIQNIETNIIGKEEIFKLLKEGWEISSHTNSHCNLIFASALRASEEFRVSKNFLRSVGVVESGLAYPGGEVSETNYQLTKRFFSYGREATNASWQKFQIIDLGNINKIDKFRLPANVINENCIKKLDLEAIFRQNRDKNKWIILTFHEIGGNLVSKDDGISLDYFKEIIRLIKKYKFQIKTVLEVTEEYDLHTDFREARKFLTKEEYAERYLGKRWLALPLSVCYRFLFLEKLVNLILRTKMLNPHYFFVVKKNQQNHTEETIGYYDKYYSKQKNHLLPEWRKSYLKRMFESLKIDEDLSKNKSKRFLDIGAGVGVTAIECAKKSLFSYGVDISPVAIQKAKILAGQQLSKEQRKFVNFQVASAEKLPFQSNYFDKICSIAVLEYVKNDQKAIDEIQRVVKPGGRIFILVSNKKPLFFSLIESWTERKSARKLRYYQAKDFIDRFEKKGFVLEDLTYHDHWPKLIQYFFQKIVPTSNSFGKKIWWKLEKLDEKLKNNSLTLLFSIVMIKK